MFEILKVCIGLLSLLVSYIRGKRCHTVIPGLLPFRFSEIRMYLITKIYVSEVFVPFKGHYKSSVMSSNF